jgi:uncharacterized protein YhfF
MAAHAPPMTEAAAIFWQRYVATLAADHPHRHARPDAFAFGDSAALADELAALVQAGRKRATASLPIEFTSAGLPLPAAGDVSIVLLADGTPVVIIEEVEVRHLPFEAVDAAFAADEGEGDGSLAWWQAAHRRYFGRVCARLGGRFDETTPVMCRRFRLVWRGEPEPPSTPLRLVHGLFGVLLVSLLVLLIDSDVVAETAGGSPPPMARGISASTLPDALVQHFRSRGIVLRPEARHGGQLTEWILENVDVGPRCEVMTSFVSFPSGADVAAMKNHLMMVSVPSVLNEQARLAVFHPNARGKTPDIRDCQAWSVKYKEIWGQVLEAFKSYRPADAGEKLDQKR